MPSKTNRAPAGQRAGSACAGGQQAQAAAGDGADAEVVEAKAAHRRGGAAEEVAVAHSVVGGRGSVGHGVLPFMWHYAHKATEVT